MVDVKPTESVEEMRIKMSLKQETLIFQNKLQLISKHLNEPNHPLRVIRKAFGQELDLYYRRFLKMDLKKNGVIRQADSSRLSTNDRLSYINPLYKEKGGRKELSSKHVKDFIVAGVKEFIKIFKWATFKFYKITRYMRS